MSQRNNVCTGLIALVPLLFLRVAFASGSLDNYVDGFDYQAEVGGNKERIVAAKVLPDNGVEFYSVSLELSEQSGNEFAAVIRDQVISHDINRHAIVEMLSDTLQGSGDNSALRINYDLSKNELLALYGEDSFLASEMDRCGLNSVALRIEIEENEFRFISPLKSQVLTNATLHKLTFCN